ncbi:hypothetical protein BH09SUM1_BH09SUM1_30320 [soil metagenome]
MPIKPETLLTADRVADLKSTNKEEVLEELIALLASSSQVTNKEELRDKILERERTLSTGVGAGMAIPHVKIASIKDFVAAVGRSKKGLNFESLDGAPTHVVVMIGCNNTQSADFLKVLAKLVSRLKDPALQKRIMEAESPAQICDMFVTGEGIFC